MKRYIIVGLIVVVLGLVVGFVLTAIPRMRTAANVVECQNHLREISLFAAQNADPSFDRAKAANAIPAGTVLPSQLPADERLSWYVTVLPSFDQKQQDTATILAGLDRGLGWQAEPNQAAARMKLSTLACPGHPPEFTADAPAPTSYVGIAGLGVDAALFPYLPDGTPSPLAGCFRYDAPTPFVVISDGLSQTLLLGEHSNELGPWLAGGPATVRGLNDAVGAKPLQGIDGQFGGCHPNVANWAFADGSVRAFTDRIDPKVLYGLSTIAGHESDVLLGE